MDDASTPQRLRIGVVGLGRLWECRHKPSLARLRDRFRVTAVYDQVARRAEIEADQLDCVACEGLTSLIERDDVDAVYLLSPQWFGLHPAHLACEAGKPVYCATPLSSQLADLERLAARLEASGGVFMPEFARRVYPATVRLQELLATRLGEPRLIVGQSRLEGFDRYAQPGPTTQVVRVPLAIDPGGFLLDWCSTILGGLPESIVATGPPTPAGGAESTGPDLESFAAVYPGGATAQVSYGRFLRGGAGKALPPSGVQVFAERGAAWLEMPDRIRWWDDEGEHEERLAADSPVGDVLNERFLRAVRDGGATGPTVRDALEVARLVQDLVRSRAEGRVIRRGDDGGGST